MLDFREQLMALKTEMNKEEVIKNIKVEVRNIDTNKQIKQVNIEVNTDDKNLHSNINKGVVMNKINYNKPIYKSENNIDLKDIKRGEILYVDIDQHGVGSEQAGIRYSVCLQNDIGNRFSPTIIVAFITSKLTKAKLPIHVEIPKEKFGLPLDSVVLLEQVRTLDKRRIIKRVGTLDDMMMYKIDKALGTSLGVKIAEPEQKKECKSKTSLEELPQDIQNIINDKLEDIRGLERTITNIKRESLIKHLMEERELGLFSLQRICKEYNINYRDYYIMYRKEEERSII